MKINWKRIEKECPRTYDAFIVCNYPYKTNFGNMTKFFDKKGIIILINLHDTYEAFIYKIYSRKVSKIIYDGNYFEYMIKRKKAEKEAIYEAFYRLEEELNNA